jgi:inorganic pyrophosphatase
MNKNSHLRFNVFIEIPIGGGLRIHYTNPSIIENYPTSSVVQALNFAAYGCIPSICNEADNEPVDAFVLAAEDVPAGAEIEAVILGIRLRNDGDHKLLMIASHSSLAETQNNLIVSNNVLSILGRWVEQSERPGERWGSFEEAQQWLNQITTA